MSQPRAEHPRPQFVRAEWVNLNGEWQFEIDRSDSGLERGVRERELAQRIIVPFAPETELSGIENVDFLEAVWYRTTVTIPADWAGKDAVLHFQAVDHDATVWVNGVEVVRHRGGFTPFSANLSKPSPRRARRPRSWFAPATAGTACRRAASRRTQLLQHGCHYTRTTGIWQTVWLEAVPSVHLGRPRITPDVAGSSFHLEVPVSANKPGWKVRAILKDADGEVTHRRGPRRPRPRAAHSRSQIPADRVRLWDTTDPHLYDVRLELIDADGNVVDAADSYAGLRSVSINGQAILINGKHVFQRLVLDQGYWPESLMTAPSEEALVADIELSLAAGFNGARLHQKVFEERFLYHADRLGLPGLGRVRRLGLGVVAEHPGNDNQQPTASYVDAVAGGGRARLQPPVDHRLVPAERDAPAPARPDHPAGRRHPGDVPGDEGGRHDPAGAGRVRVLAPRAGDRRLGLAQLRAGPGRVRAADGRPCGRGAVREHRWARAAADLPAVRRAAVLLQRVRRHLVEPGSGGQPQGNNTHESWGYGQRVADEEAFYDRFAGLVDVLLDNPLMFGYCYTQLTDVFQEENGIYRFDRSTKLDVPRIQGHPDPRGRLREGLKSARAA